MPIPPDPQGLRLLLARHGATDWNAEQRYQGRTDLPLAAAGRAQAALLAEWLRAETPAVAIHSGSRRAAETLGLALAGRAVAVERDERWREIDHGAWEGLTYRDLLERFPAEAAAHWADPWSVPAPGGETLAAVAGRVAAAGADLLARWPGATVLLVAHATPLQLLLCQLLGAPPAAHWRWKLDLGGLSCVQLYGAGPIVNWLNRGYAPPPPCG